MNSLVNHFHNRFDVLTDATDEVEDLAFRLRYQVYCVERGHTGEVSVADGRESDLFDGHAMHVVVRDRRCGTDKATARLVTAGVARDGLFPIEHTYPDLFARHGIDDSLLPRGRTVEISRFAVSKELRERAPVSNRPTAAAKPVLDTRVRDLPGGHKNRRPLVTFGLILGLMRLGASHGVTHCIAVMEPSLLRLLARAGIRFTLIGRPLEYHGLRQPCYARVDELLEGIRKAQVELWHLLAGDDLIASFYRPELTLPAKVRVQGKPVDIGSQAGDGLWQPSSVDKLTTGAKAPAGWKNPPDARTDN